MPMLSTHSYFEIKDRNVKSDRFMKSGIIVSHCVGRNKIYPKFVFSKFSVVL